MYAKQNFCINRNVLYLSNNSYHTVIFYLPEFSSSFTWELQSYEKENRKKVIITLAFMFTESIQKFTPISILDDSFEKSRKL